jgi:hypothetical protein
MASSRSLVGGLPRLALVVLAGYVAGSVQSAPSWTASADRVLDWLRQPMQITQGALLLGILVVGAYILQSLRPKKQRVMVLDFAVHNPHPR